MPSSRKKTISEDGQQKIRFQQQKARCKFIWSVTNIFQSIEHETIRWTEVKVLKIFNNFLGFFVI